MAHVGRSAPFPGRRPSTRSSWQESVEAAVAVVSVCPPTAGASGDGDGCGGSTATGPPQPSSSSSRVYLMGPGQPKPPTVGCGHPRRAAVGYNLPRLAAPGRSSYSGQHGWTVWWWPVCGAQRSHGDAAAVGYGQSGGGGLWLEWVRAAAPAPASSGGGGLYWGTSLVACHSRRKISPVLAEWMIVMPRARHTSLEVSLLKPRFRINTAEFWA